MANSTQKYGENNARYNEKDRIDNGSNKEG